MWRSYLRSRGRVSPCCPGSAFGSADGSLRGLWCRVRRWWVVVDGGWWRPSANYHPLPGSFDKPRPLSDDARSIEVVMRQMLVLISAVLIVADVAPRSSVIAQQSARGT